MQSTANIARPAAGPARQRKPLALRLLDVIAAWDARYREMEKLKRMPQYRLDDMGIPADKIRGRK